MKPADAHAHAASGKQPDTVRRSDDPEQDERPPLTHQEAVALFGETALRPARMTPFRVVALQLGVTVLAMLVWYAVRHMTGGAAEAAAVSALIGGACVVIPNAVFALRLALTQHRPTVGGLILGEMLKIVITLGMLIAASMLYGSMDWPAMLVTFLLALKMLWIALVLR
ncbi:ATP synthase subunit I [Imbroritus primus]|uniref:ATP synthase subunit I n=1 Tax=Imbroritus primus TaxID=3058603 RepID=A0ACD3SNP6_9BURK|nr:ATP synthase subunit I [Burkholderiaceae bacterium PBA]